MQDKKKKTRIIDRILVDDTLITVTEDEESAKEMFDNLPPITPEELSRAKEDWSNIINKHLQQLWDKFQKIKNRYERAEGLLISEQKAELNLALIEISELRRITPSVDEVMSQLGGCYPGIASSLNSGIDELIGIIRDRINLLGTTAAEKQITDSTHDNDSTTAYLTASKIKNRFLNAQIEAANGLEPGQRLAALENILKEIPEDRSDTYECKGIVLEQIERARAVIRILPVVVEKNGKGAAPGREEPEQPKIEISRFAIVKTAPDDKSALHETDLRLLENEIRNHNRQPTIKEPGKTLENMIDRSDCEVYYCPKNKFYWILKSDAKKIIFKSSGRPKKR
jgi:hypothetical protein